MKRHFIVRECSDYDVIYGLLIVYSNVSEEDVEKAIGQIKDSFNKDEEIPNWTVEEVIAELPFECEYIEFNGNVEI